MSSAALNGVAEQQIMCLQCLPTSLINLTLFLSELLETTLCDSSIIRIVFLPSIGKYSIGSSFGTLFQSNFSIFSFIIAILILP